MSLQQEGDAAHKGETPLAGLPPTPPDSVHNDSHGTELPLPPGTNIPTSILDIDKPTPDHHVARDPRLIRLTGTHPFNVEAPLSALYDEGFLTSPELFYVRNHGAVPEVHDEDIPNWEFSIEGLVEEPFTLTLKQMISDFEQLTYPITLVCAGNRRKEQNVVRKSKGFSWGPAGVSTALFTGCSMWDVIKKAKPMRGAKYVCMEGADKLPNGYYGTCAKLNWVKDPNKGVMLAHKMNGEMLRPDHGKPLRAVIPGQIGGRSVKWLKKLIVTAGPSENWYHIYDNRVLPTMVSPQDSANSEHIWKDERYAIYDLNTNSATAFPAHDERLSITTGPADYNVRGYAYGGGGRRVTRVELSLDKGKSWRLANICYPEDMYREAEQTLYGGKLDFSWREASFCWCFWSLEIEKSELARSQDILVRAMDESMNIQPRDMYWSVLGMMNNPWYRVAILLEGDELKFEHPTQPALIPGGWMERVKKAGGNLLNGSWGEKLNGEEDAAPAEEAVSEVVMIKEGLTAELTVDELRTHGTKDSPWFVINGHVYDGTAFLNDHPGGAQSIISSAGVDATEEFMAIHSETAKAMMPTYHIGSLNEASRTLLAAGDLDANISDPSTRPTFLDSRSWTHATLVTKTHISWDTRLFRFALAAPKQTLGLPIGQHIMARLKDPVTRESIIRSYTPISPTTLEGFVDLLVKVYFDTPTVKGGKMTKAMDSIPLGHFIDFKGPTGKFIYTGNGTYTINGKPGSVKRFYMISGGSGITPIFQVLRAVITNPEDPTHCTVLNGNRLLEDILCRDELEVFAKDQMGRCNLLHTLTRAPENWEGLRGRIGKELLEKEVQRDGESLVLICGPEALEKSVHKSLNEMGWLDEELLFF